MSMCNDVSRVIPWHFKKSIQLVAKVKKNKAGNTPESCLEMHPSDNDHQLNEFT